MGIPPPRHPTSPRVASPSPAVVPPTEARCCTLPALALCHATPPGLGGWGSACDLNQCGSGRSGDCIRNLQEFYPPPWGAFGCSGVGTPRRWAGTALRPLWRGLCRHPRQLLALTRQRWPLRQVPYASLLASGMIPPPLVPNVAPLGSHLHGFPPGLDLDVAGDGGPLGQGTSVWAWVMGGDL